MSILITFSLPTLRNHLRRNEHIKYSKNFDEKFSNSAERDHVLVGDTINDEDIFHLGVLHMRTANSLNPESSSVPQAPVIPRLILAAAPLEILRVRDYFFNGLL
ncbi:hypothetical protein CEXT_661221 [Caerostris extrusa]|uniref:Uncharacterized protein n=1 Tax=Caerostris extrusa TaxID=172846 RepID=A0AAV4UA22_CAEEX|nr:hypothetical protein CEXT_661221 [Caerostris extrusa]